jgi:hypothetical protein
MQVNLKSVLILLAGFTFQSGIAVAAPDNDVSPANKTQFSVLYGGYTLSAPSLSKPSVSQGSFSLGFQYRIFNRISAIAAYNNLMGQTFNSIVSGVDIGAQYCFFNCTAMKQRIGNTATVVSWAPWGIQIGAGLSQRSFLVKTASVGFSGPFVKLETNYMLGDKFKILGASQFNYMINGSNILTHLTIQLGLGFDFGENVFSASNRPSS